MKKIDDFLENVDQRVEHTVEPFWLFMQKYFVIFSASLLTLLMIIFFVRVFKDRNELLGDIIKEDLARIDRILNQIDKDCDILSIRSDRAVIDFLTVEKFAGSMVGCLNLAHPKKWAGPYVRQNPSIEGRLYEFVRTKEGYFVLPGRGVKLPSGDVLGKDILIGWDTPLGTMLAKGGALNHKGQPMGLRITFKIGDWKVSHPNEQTIDKINNMLKEFNEALPFAQSEFKESVKSC